MSSPVFFFDENISHRIVKALSALEHPVEHLLDHFPQGTKDTEYFPFVADKGWFLVTQDRNIKKKVHEREALTSAGLGCFIFTGRADKTTDEFTIALLNRLPEMTELAMTTDRPFIFGIPNRGGIAPLTRRTRSNLRRENEK